MGYNIEIEYQNSPNEQFKCENFKIAHESIVFLDTNLMTMDSNIRVHIVPYSKIKTCSISDLKDE